MAIILQPRAVNLTNYTNNPTNKSICTFELPIYRLLYGLVNPVELYIEKSKMPGTSGHP